jgi:hypothetical protein
VGRLTCSVVFRLQTCIELGAVEPDDGPGAVLGGFFFALGVMVGFGFGGSWGWSFLWCT